MTQRLYPLLLALGAAALLWVEWHTDEVIVVLALLLVIAAALGFARPGAALVTGVVIGLVIPLAHFASIWSGRFQPSYQAAPPSYVDWLVMAALVLPALAAALVGAWARRRIAPA